MRMRAYSFIPAEVTVQIVRSGEEGSGTSFEMRRVKCLEEEEAAADDDDSKGRAAVFRLVEGAAQEIRDHDESSPEEAHRALLPGVRQRRLARGCIVHDSVFSTAMKPVLLSAS